MTTAVYQPFNTQLPWAIGEKENRLFRKVTYAALGFTLSAAVIVSLQDLPQPTRAEKAKLPPQLARIIKAKTPPPPPKVEPVKQPEIKKPVVEKKPPEQPKVTPPKPVPVKQPVQQKPQPKPEPVVDKQQEVKLARENAKKSGVLAFSDQLMAMRQSVSVDNLANTEQIKGAGQQHKTQRKTIGKKVNSTSAGVNAASLSSDVGAKGSLEGRKTTEFVAPEEGSAALATKRIERETQVIGDRDIEAIRKTLDANKGAIYSLYRRALRKDPSLQGKLTVKLVIEANGSVSNVSLVHSELEAPELERKLLARIGLIQFGSENVTQTQLEYAFNFLPF